MHLVSCKDFWEVLVEDDRQAYFMDSCRSCPRWNLLFGTSTLKYNCSCLRSIFCSCVSLVSSAKCSDSFTSFLSCRSTFALPQLLMSFIAKTQTCLWKDTSEQIAQCICPSCTIFLNRIRFAYSSYWTNSQVDHQTRTFCPKEKLNEKKDPWCLKKCIVNV